MRKRRILQTLPVFIIAFFFILYITIQLRAHGVNINKIDALHNKPSPNLVQRSIQEVYYGAEKDAPSESDFTQQPVGDEAHKEIFTRNNRTSQKAHNVTPSSALKLTDLFIAVKTTGRFHRTRLALLLDTWISRTKEHTFIFTDTDDPGVSSRGYNMVVTDCHSDHSQQALSCKMSAEYDHFMASDKRWLCHVDDDNYVNPTALLSLLSTFPANGDIYVGKPSLDRPITAHELLEGNDTREVHFWFATGGAGFCLSRRLAQRMAPWASGSRFEQTSAAIRLPDDCTVGFIVEKRLGVSLVHCPLFHSHLENLLLISPSNVAAQVTLSYGMFENKLNSIEMKGIFSKEEDPSRFKTVHCMLYPFTSWCP